MRIYIRVLTVAIFVLSLSSFALALDLKDLKGVQLNDGTLIQGKVIESNIYKVVIEKMDGNRVSVKFDDVSNFLKDEQIEGDIKQEVKQEVKKEMEQEKSVSPAQDTAKGLYKGANFDLMAEISSIKYEEPGLMEEKGMMYGIVGSYAYHNDLMLKVEGRFSYGKVDYEGATWGGTPVSANNIGDYLFDFRGLIGYDFAVLNATALTPYIGFGYRYLNSNSHKDPGFYERKSNYIYIPIGVEAVTNLNNGWSWGAAIEYDFFLWGKQKSYLSDLLPGFNDVENRQNKGYGLRGSINFVKKGEKVGFIIEPFIRYWNIKESKHSALTFYGTYVTDVWEPNNESTEIGCNLGVRF
jgi:hypothetical protein